MRKFVIKNRPKRKYTRKTEEVSSFSFAKTAYGMMLVFVMFVIFMATIIISTPFRNSISQIKFSFQLPQFSLNDPLHFIQAFVVDITRASVAVWAILEMIAQTTQYAMTTLDPHPIITLLANGVVFLGTSISNIVIFIGQVLSNILSSSIKIVINTDSFIITSNYTYLLFIVHTIQITAHASMSLGSILLQICNSIVIVLYQMMVTIVLVIAQIVTDIVVTVVHVLWIIFSTVWTWLIATWDAIMASLSHAMKALYHIISIPFKILYAFWLQIKPYANFFGHHVQMTGRDLANGFASWGKVASLMSSSK